MNDAGVLTDNAMIAIYRKLLASRPSEWSITLPPQTARLVDWYTRKPLVRAAHRAAGYPFGRNQGAFKRWALLVGRYP